MMFKKMLLPWLPYCCILCGTRSDRDQDLCTACYLDLPKSPPACLCCGVILHYSPHLICGNCLHIERFFDNTYTLFEYRQPIPALLMGLKFKRHLVYARILGELFAAYRMQIIQPLPQIIIPIPLHPKRLRERGFNQSLELARPVAKKLQLPLASQATERIKPTAAQAELPAHQRKLNVKDAFKVRQSVQGLHIAVLDDVITTGNTLFEFCKLLKQHGAASIEIWCIARSVFRPY